jgi:hypothetical protein
MKKLLLITTVFAASCSAGDGAQQNASQRSEQQSKPLPHFEFRHLRPAKTTLREAKQQGIVSDCLTSDVGGQEDASCFFENGQVGDVPTGRTRVIFDNGLFDWFSIEFSTDYFDNMVEQARQVYGKPCETSRQELQNAYGAQFSGDEIRWCFVEGQLVVRRHSHENFRLGEFEFFTEKPEQPRKTYDANSL